MKRGLWKRNKNQRLFVNKLGEVLGIARFEDWYNISHTKLCQIPQGSHLLVVHQVLLLLEANNGRVLFA
jgi:hypothetical protein